MLPQWMTKAAQLASHARRALCLLLALARKRRYRGCQGITSLPQWLPRYVLEPSPGPRTWDSWALVFCWFRAAPSPERKEKHGFFIFSERIRGPPVGDACSRAY